jgi:hypothetical protein
VDLRPGPALHGVTDAGQPLMAPVNGDWWFLDLAAPSGQVLAPGTYTGAPRNPFNSFAEPDLSVGGNGRGCNTLTGSFTISNVVFGPNGYVQTLDAHVRAAL